MKKFWKTANFRLKAGLISTCFFLIIGFVVYFIPHTNPFTYNTYPNNLGVSAEHWLGTTSMGQDIVWLLIEAIHNSLMIGLIVATIGTVVGVLVGLLAGFCRRRVGQSADDYHGYFRSNPVSADSDHDDFPDERKLHCNCYGTCSCDVRMGMAKPSDPFHGSDNQRA